MIATRVSIRVRLHKGSPSKDSLMYEHIWFARFSASLWLLMSCHTVAQQVGDLVILRSNTSLGGRTGPACSGGQALVTCE